MSTKITRPVLRYHGGKYRIAPWIIAHMPPHRSYVEPYCGAASVLLLKPRAHMEIINDLDDDIVNVFRVLRNPALAQELAMMLSCTAYARKEFNEAHEPIPTVPCEGRDFGPWVADPAEQARRTIVRSFMSFGSMANGRKHRRSGFRASGRGANGSPSRDWANLPAAIPALVERLRGVTIECRPALELIQTHDDPDTLFYCDPPYVRSTRSSMRWESESAYAHEMTDDDHRALGAALEQCCGMVILSGYRGELYDTLFSHWTRFDLNTVVSHAAGNQPATESLWLNPAAAARMPQRSLELEVA